VAEEESKSFWTTAPGFLTALATFLTAVVGLLTFLNQCTGPGAAPSSTSAPSLTVQSAVLSSEERTPFADHLVTVRLTAPGDFLAHVESVTYLMPPSFNSATYTSSSPADGFALTFQATGSFRLQAKVHLNDGGVEDVVEDITLAAP
jgi:hypothetical protein